MDTDVRPLAPRRLAWLDNETARWVSEGILDEDTAAKIKAQYVASRAGSLTRVVSYLGGAFVGIGLVWLVATNLDALTPLVRFVGIVVIWLAFTAAAEVLTLPRSLRGAFRGVAAMSFGGVVFQAAQSLQVPAYEASLVGVWGLGALAYAYASSGLAPLVVGVVTTMVWFEWQVVASSESTFAGVFAVLVGGVAAFGMAALHDRRLEAFAQVWRLAGGVLTLGGLFVAAVPQIGDRDLTWSPTLVVALAFAVLLVAVAAARTDGLPRWEVLASALIVPIGLGLVAWDPQVDDLGSVSGEAWLSAFVSIAVYVVVAGAVAVDGSLRDHTLLVVLATGALVVFTTMQSFAVFAPIMSGATLFLLLGTLLLATGLVFDRARRGVAANLNEALS
ncbi:DUF2157 domain-containing protein [Nocardioides albus]|uniref:Putative membrane protein n=1 Tax=Nocardioides albus TaxID=1841 RepID=A0A7W5A8G2_9ACTN|nr:DUF2157 domain-containing protein [Nocardioides albus]MBB3091425.1 putative membrane protein [Nocardioides albus]GGU39359.1 hypothetical protein GCM10007979_43030 [Nocardioides albus]